MEKTTELAEGRVGYEHQHRNQGIEEKRKD